MRTQIKTGIGVAMLAGAILATAHAQTAQGSQKKSGNSQATVHTQTNGTDGERKSGQVVHQDYDKVQAGKPEGPSGPPDQRVTQGSTAENKGTADSKTKFRQEFGPTQANKKNDVIAPSGSGGKGGKPKTADAKTLPPK